MGEADAGELHQLKRCLRDLLALTALPAGWTGNSPEEIAVLCADVLLATFRLDAVCVCVQGEDIDRCLVIRGGGRTTQTDRHDVTSELAKHAENATLNVRVQIPGSEDGLQAIALPIGHQGQFGRVMLASHLPSFPDAYERILLEVCINQTATALTQACLLKQLRQANAALRQSNDDLAQYAYAASHDLQEPLRTITTYTQLLDRRYRAKLGEGADEVLREVVSSAKRMEQLIRDLLSHSKLSAGIEQVSSGIDMADVVRIALEDLHQAIVEANASVTTEALPVVIGEASQLRELFQNLIGNAVKYRRLDAPVRIHIGASRQGREWMFVISDNGQGFDQRYAEKIFGVFTRLHSKQVPGTGMGLAICKKIVERHGGRIWAESSVGQGARFYFTLPAVADLAASDVPAH